MRIATAADSCLINQTDQYQAPLVSLYSLYLHNIMYIIYPTFSVI